MAKLTYDSTNEVWKLQQQTAGAGTVTHRLETENTFLDKDIDVVTTTPAAGTATLTVSDNTENVTVGTAAGGKFPLTAPITGQMTFATPGWITVGGQTAADNEVQVGQINQSIIQNGATTIASGSNIIPSTTADQTITITEGYEGARTIVVKSMSTGETAEATITASQAATAPTLANTSSAQTNKTQVPVSPVRSAELTASSIDKYYVAVTPTAPATTFSEANITKTVDSTGYLSTNDQINASASTTASSQLYYLPLTTGNVSTAMQATTVTPTLAGSNASVTGKTRVDATPTQTANDISTYYMAVTATAPATAVGLTSTTNPGYITSADVTTTTGSTTAGTNTYYIPLATGTKSAGAGAVSAASTNMTITEEASQPASGHYFSTTGSGTANISSGWYNASTTQTSNNATKYYSIPDATFETSGNAVVAATAGYIDQGSPVATVTAGSLSTGTASKAAQGYNTLADSSVVIPTDDQGNGGYLYIAPGYYTATQISLGTLIPDQNTEDAVSANILSGYEAFTTDGKRLIGSIATYDGDYTTL